MDHSKSGMEREGIGDVMLVLKLVLMLGSCVDVDVDVDVGWVVDVVDC